MKIRTALLLFALLSAGAQSAVPAADLEFNGVLVAAGQTQVSLLDLRTGAAQWVPVGGQFGGYVVASYDSAKDTIALMRDGRPTAGLRLKNAVILVAIPLSPWSQPSNEQRAAVADNLRQLAAAAARYFADTGLDAATPADLVGPGKLIAELTPAAGESYADLVLRRDTPAMSVTTLDGTRIATDGTSTASDGSLIQADGGRIATNGTHFAPDGTVVATTGNQVAEGPFIPPNAPPGLASALQAVGWKFRPASPAVSL